MYVCASFAAPETKVSSIKASPPFPLTRSLQETPRSGGAPVESRAPHRTSSPASLRSKPTTQQLAIRSSRPHRSISGKPSST